MIPDLAEVLAHAHVVAVPLKTRFRGITTREAMLIEGPQGWTEFAPFAEYGDSEATVWLRAAYAYGWNELPAFVRTRIGINATVPAVDASEVERVLSAFGSCRTAKVKVAERGQTLAEDVARVARVRELMGAEGRIRIDANGAWNVDEAERALHALAPFDLEYVEQPCADIDELAQIRERIAYMDIPVAADESVRKREDPLEVARLGAADVLVVKAAPLGGVRAARDIVQASGLPAVVSSALDTSIGIGMGLALAASLPTCDFDCGLGTAALLAGDVVDQPLIPVDGYLDVMPRPVASAHLLTRFAADAERSAWWHARLDRVHRALEAGVLEA